jgi:hypothetical protein
MQLYYNPIDLDIFICTKLNLYASFQNIWNVNQWTTDDKWYNFDFNSMIRVTVFNATFNNISVIS